jgi:hypothetical protein
VKAPQTPFVGSPATYTRYLPLSSDSLVCHKEKEQEGLILIKEELVPLFPYFYNYI